MTSAGFVEEEDDGADDRERILYSRISANHCKQWIQMSIGLWFKGSAIPFTIEYPLVGINAENVTHEIRTRVSGVLSKTLVKDGVSVEARRPFEHQPVLIKGSSCLPWISADHLVSLLHQATSDRCRDDAAAQRKNDADRGDQGHQPSAL